MEDLSKHGIRGDPYIGTSEIGEKIVKKLVGYGVEFVKQFNDANTVIK